MSVNKVLLLGNVGKAPEIRDSQSGRFATFSLATTDRAYQRKDGTQVPERTEWHNIVANGNIVQVIERYVTAGTKLFIEGKLRTRKYTDRNNVERYTTEVILENMELLGSKPQQEQAQASNPAPAFYNQQRYQQAPPSVQQNWGGSDNAPF